jgi:hypothetical protein
MTEVHRTEETVDTMSMVDKIAKNSVFSHAFPLGPHGGEVVTHGLTKRELFAAMAMQGAVASGQLRGPNDCVSYAIQCADTLLKELAK